MLVAFVLPFVPRGVRWHGGSFAVWHELYDLRWYVSPTTGGVVWSSVDLGYSVSYNILVLIPLVPFILGLASALFLLRAFRRNTLTKFRTFLVGTIILAVFFLKANLYLLLLPAGAQAMLMRETAPYTLMIGVLETGRGVVNPSTFVVLALGVLLALNVLCRKLISYYPMRVGGSGDASKAYKSMRPLNDDRCTLDSSEAVRYLWANNKEEDFQVF